MAAGERKHTGASPAVILSDRTVTAAGSRRRRRRPRRGGATLAHVLSPAV